MVIGSSPLEKASDACALVLSGDDLEAGADARRPLSHPHHSVRIEAAAVAVAEPDPVVEDLEGGRPAVATPDDAHLRGLGMALDVRERLLADPPHLPLLEDRDAGAPVGEET